MVGNTKVLHVVSISMSLPCFIGEQFTYFNEKGVSFYVACQKSPHLDEYSKLMGFKKKEVNILREINLKEDYRAIRDIMRYIKEEGIDVVIAHTPKGGLIGMIAAFLAGVKRRTYFRHGLVFETATGLKRFLLKMVERFSGLLATQVVCVSPSVLKISEKEKLSKPAKNTLLKFGTCNGIDTQVKFNPERLHKNTLADLKKHLGIANGDKVIGFVGRLSNDKGISELLSAWEIVKATHNNVKLLIAGPFDERDILSDGVRGTLINDPDIICTGMITDTTKYYGIMDIFILPSYREGFPTVVLEASSMGLPIITTKATGCRDSIIENKTGIFIDFEPENIAKAIAFYLNDAELAEIHGRNGRKFVQERFEQHLIWQEIEKHILTGEFSEAA